MCKIFKMLKILSNIVAWGFLEHYCCTQNIEMLEVGNIAGAKMDLDFDVRIF